MLCLVMVASTEIFILLPKCPITLSQVLVEAIHCGSVSEAITLHKRNMHKLLTETASATAELEGEIHGEDDGYFMAFGPKGDTDDVVSNCMQCLII